MLNKKRKISTIIISLILLLSMGVPVCAETEVSTNDDDNLYEESYEENTESTGEVTYDEAIRFLQEKNVKSEQLEKLKQICIGREARSASTDTSLFEQSIESLTNQARCYSFSDEQIAEYIDGLIESTPSTVINNQTPVLRGSDHVRPFPDEGAGYEVQSKTGYTESTAYGIVGQAYTKKPQGQAAYMFFTVGRQGPSAYKSNDYGLGYFDGKWWAFAGGKFTGWDQKELKYPIKSGQKIYMHVALSGNNIRLRILDGNNFSKVFWDGLYSHGGFLPTNGNEVHFNRQITLCDSQKKLGTSIYINNAQFYDSFLYNKSGYEKYSSTNTTAKRRGRFKADWTNYSNVTVHDSLPWYKEMISIKF